MGRCKWLMDSVLRIQFAFKFRSTLFKFVLFGGTWVRAKRGGHLLSLLYKERQGQNLPSGGTILNSGNWDLTKGNEAKEVRVTES
jgi:hypothetical protein